MKHQEQKIVSLSDLEIAARGRKSVFCPGIIVWSKPTPAAFIINLHGNILLRMFNSGMYIYDKETK